MNDNNQNEQNKEQVEVDEIISENDNSSMFIIGNDGENPLEDDADMSAKKRKKDKRKKEKKKHRGLRAIIWVLVLIIIAVGVSYFAVAAFTDITGIRFTKDVNTIELEIPQGSSTADIAEILEKNGAIEHPFIFRLYSKITGEDGKYQYGLYTVESNAGYSGLIHKLQTIGARAEEMQFTIPEGSNIGDIMDILSKKDKNGKQFCTKDEFRKAMNSGSFKQSFISDIPSQSVYYLLEGYLYADTYKFAYVEDDGESNARRAIDKMLDTCKERIFTDENIAKAEKMGYSMHEILTMASIVQLEASSSEENMPKVAQVFFNRLDKNSDFSPKRLESNATDRYSKKYSKIYDTYNIEGLPPGPIASPSAAAVKAVLNPDKSVTEFYFVTDKNGKFYYSATYQEHLNVLKKLDSSGLRLTYDE